MIMSSCDSQPANHLDFCAVFLIIRYSVFHVILAVHDRSITEFNIDGVCVFDDSYDRVLAGYSFIDSGMTVQMCLSTCRNRGFPYAGLQWQIECHCGKMPAGGFEWAWPDKCDDRCAGNSNQVFMIKIKG